jgi:hypothetical protein
MHDEDWDRLMFALQGLGLVRLVVDKRRGFIGGYLPPTKD